MRSALKNRVHAILAKHGIKRGGPATVTNGAAHPEESEGLARPAPEEKGNAKGRPAAKPAN